MAVAVGAPEAVAAVLGGWWLVSRLGAPGRAAARALGRGAAACALYVLLDVVAAPQAVRVPANPYTVGVATVLGAPGVALVLLAHALYR
jgi:hypothetical protein